jgi:hypothetical protein
MNLIDTIAENADRSSKMSNKEINPLGKKTSPTQFRLFHTIYPHNKKRKRRIFPNHHFQTVYLFRHRKNPPPERTDGA